MSTRAKIGNQVIDYGIIYDKKYWRLFAENSKKHIWENVKNHEK